MKKKLNVILAFAVLTGALCFSILPATAFGQLDRIGKGRAKNMLSRVTKDLKKYYYDKNLHGVDLDARTEQAKDRIDKAKTLGEAFGIIAQVLLDLDDAHTVFYPPARAVKFEYGWKLGAVVDKCFFSRSSREATLTRKAFAPATK